MLRSSLAALAVAFSAGCSFQLSLPPSEPHQRTAVAARDCGADPRYGGPITFALVDTASTAAGITWVVSGNAEKDPSRADQKRAFGYGAIGLFGLGAAYGYYVVAQCSELRDEVARRGGTVRPLPATKTASRHPFPTNVFGFEFESTVKESERVCTASGRSWSRNGSAASCEGPLMTARADQVQLEFEFGELQRISVFYGPSEQLNADYHKLHALMRERYGSPQRDEALSAACGASLSDCLAAGERPRGATWAFAAGSIQLRPVLIDERPRIELRHSGLLPLPR